MKKVLIGVLILVILAGIAFAGAYFFVPEVKEKVNVAFDGLVNEIKDNDDEKSDYKNDDSVNDINDEAVEQQKTEERKKKIQEDERFKSFDDEIKEKILDEFDTIVDSDAYKKMTNRRKDQLVNKLIESEVVQEQTKVEQAEYEARHTEVKDKVTNILGVEENASVEEISNNFSETKQQLQDIINSEDSSLEQIAEAESKLKEIESVEQEFVYFETIENVSETMANDIDYNLDNSDLKLHKLKGVYMLHDKPYVSADFIKEEVVAGVPIYSLVNQFVCVITSEILTGDETYQEIWNIVSNCITLRSLGVRNVNLVDHQKVLEKNENLNDCFSELREEGYELKVIESWDYGQANQPYFIIEGQKWDETKYFKFSPISDMEYRIDEIEKICPEFWAQLEIEDK